MVFICNFTSKMRKMENIILEINNNKYHSWLQVVGDRRSNCKPCRKNYKYRNKQRWPKNYNIFPTTSNRNPITLESIIGHKHIPPDVVVIYLRNNPEYCELQFRFPLQATLIYFMANINPPRYCY